MQTEKKERKRRWDADIYLDSRSLNLHDIHAESEYTVIETNTDHEAIIFVFIMLSLLFSSVKQAGNS